MSLNVFTFSGRLGNDAELRRIQSGDSVLQFSVANEIGFGDRKRTQWIRCNLWGRRGEAICDYLKKGNRVVVSGEVCISEYERQGATKVTQLEVRVAEVDFSSNRQDDGGSRGGGGSARDSRPQQGGGQQQRGGWDRPPPGDDLSDDIPF